MKRIDEAQRTIQAVADRDERAFLEVAFKTALVDVRAGANDQDFDYQSFIEVMMALYGKRELIIDVLQGNADKHRWWPDD